MLRDKDGTFLGGVETFRDLSVIKRLTREVSQKYSFQDIISKHPAILRLFDILPDIAQSHASVLIQGESGTGKELVARAIHVKPVFNHKVSQSQSFIIRHLIFF